MRFTVHNQNCREAMAAMDAESIDAIVTDPPYGLSFMGKDWDHGVPGVEFWTEAMRVAKPGTHLLAFGGTRTYHRLAVAIEDAGWEIRDCIMWVYGSGFPKSHNLKNEWQGWGTALKPAWEPIIVARKPLAGTVAKNVLKHGTGAINVDGCRIPTRDTIPRVTGKEILGGTTPGWDSPWKSDPEAVARRQERADEAIEKANRLGRWPANVAHDGSEEVIRLFPETTSGSRNAGVHRVAAGQGRYGEFAEGHMPEIVGSTGSAARFFYCAKASKADRDEGLANHPDREKYQAASGAWGVHNCFSGKDGDDAWKAKNPNLPRKNNHPTVKPTDLMRYLCRLVTPPNGTVFDPFCGSGSTGKAAVAEGFNFIGCEIDAEHAKIAEARIAAAVPHNLFVGVDA